MRMRTYDGRSVSRANVTLSGLKAALDYATVGVVLVV
jgi:hypothetical protein